MTRSDISYLLENFAAAYSLPDAGKLTPAVFREAREAVVDCAVKAEAFIDQEAKALGADDSDDSYLALERTCVAQAKQLQEQARIITELRQLRDAVGKLKDANVTGAVERAYAAQPTPPAVSGERK